MIDNNDKKQIEEMIANQIKLATKFSQRKLGDTPTDDNQLTPRGYVNLSGSAAERPNNPSKGQQYFCDLDTYPWFYDGNGNWRNAFASIVAGL